MKINYLNLFLMIVTIYYAAEIACEITATFNMGVIGGYVWWVILVGIFLSFQLRLLPPIKNKRVT